jgi:hypothetical protein
VAPKEGEKERRRIIKENAAREKENMPLGGN